MNRDTRDEWPDDVPIGTFDIEPGTIKDYAATAHMMFVCPNRQRCTVLLGPEFANRSSEDRLCVWKWDGNLERPTLSPSINCIAVDKAGQPTGGCGWHGHIIAGEFK